jgi:hypothetical protein
LSVLLCFCFVCLALPCFCFVLVVVGDCSNASFFFLFILF